jgi:hypothetical protein
LIRHSALARIDIPGVDATSINPYDEFADWNAILDPLDLEADFVAKDEGVGLCDAALWHQAGPGPAVAR